MQSAHARRAWVGTLTGLCVLVASVHATAQPELHERTERALLEGTNVPGVLVRVAPGLPGRGLGVTVHGINGSPSDVTPLSRELVERGAETLTFAYDDNYRRLSASAADLAGALRPHLDARPGEPLEVWAHSMGSRISLVAIELLAQEGALERREVRLELVAPPLGGYPSANLARFGGDLVSGIRNLQPALDMGTTCAFQQRLEALRLPAGVRVRVFLASADDVVSDKEPHLLRVIGRVSADVVRLPRATHVSSVHEAALWLADRRGRRRPITKAVLLGSALSEEWRRSPGRQP